MAVLANVACAEVDNICGENGVPVPEMDAIVLKWLGGKNLEDLRLKPHPHRLA